MAQAHHEIGDCVEVEILYVRGSHARGADPIDTDDEHYELTRDLRAFGEAIVEQRDDVATFADVEAAYVALAEPVEYRTEDLHDTRDVLRSVHERCQGPRVCGNGMYDGREHRSMGVGDVIRVDGVPWLVARFGFERFDGEE